MIFHATICFRAKTNSFDGICKFDIRIASFTASCSEMRINRKTRRENIKNNTFSNFYLLYGEDDYMKNLYKNKLKTALLNGSDEMNFSLFTDKVDINAVTNMATTLPFFHDKRVIFIQDSNLFKEANDLADFLPTMPDTTYFVFIENSVDKINVEKT